MGKFARKIWSVPGCFGVLFRKIIAEPLAKRCFAQCGRGFSLGPRCRFAGMENINIGDNVSFGANTQIMTTRANVFIGNDVMFGPNVLIVSGNHRTDIAGRPMKSIRDDEKRPEDDEDIIIGDDVWIGGGATILKGCTIGEGSVIAAGAVVTGDVDQYSVYGGVPARKIALRFR